MLDKLNPCLLLLPELEMSVYRGGNQETSPIIVIRVLRIQYMCEIILCHGAVIYYFAMHKTLVILLCVGKVFKI